MGKSIFQERRALSVPRAVWQSRATGGSAKSMKRLVASALISPALLALAMAPANASKPVPGGEIGTLEIGHYVCELAGDATGPVGRHVPDADFRITNASSYRVNGVGGSYLLTGDRVVLTSGLRNGERYRRISSGFLRKTEPDGSDGPLRCVLTSRRHG